MFEQGQNYLHYKPGILAHTAAPALQSSFFQHFSGKKFCPKLSIMKNNLEFISYNYFTLRIIEIHFIFIENYLDFVIEINWPLFKYRIYHHNFDCFFLCLSGPKGLTG